MDYPHRVFYREGARGSLKVSDARIVEETNNKRVFHTDDDTVRAIKSSDDETKILGEDGEMEETRLDYVWEKMNENELYVYGGGYYATGCEVYYYGDHNGKIDSEGGVNLRVNDTEISGSADYDNNWDWSILDNGDASLVEVGHTELSDFFNGSCVYIGYESEIDTFEIFRSVI